MIVRLSQDFFANNAPFSCEGMSKKVKLFDGCKGSGKETFFFVKTKKNKVSAKTRSLSIGTFFTIHFDTTQDYV